MSDRELLELAAKAVGIAGKWVRNYGCGEYFYLGSHDGIMIKHPSGGVAVWNPLEDDGEALRLAVRLGISLEIDSIHCDDPEVAVIAYGDEVYQASLGSDPYTATRRAIVRAAAEIGRAMP